MEILQFDISHMMMIGGFLSGLFHAISHPAQAVSHLIHNPASSVVPVGVRNSSAYRNIVRPIVKVGTGAATGFVTSGFNPLGALAGGVTSAIGGGLTNNAFRPLPNLVGPGVAGFGVGAATGKGLGGSARNAIQQMVGNGGVNPNGAITHGGVTKTSGGFLSKLGGAANSLVGGSGSNLANLAQQGIGAYLSNQSARRAAAIQAQAGQNANNTTWNMFNQNRADLSPWATTGGAALNQLGGESLGPNAPLTRGFTAADFQSDPGYQFRKSEGQKAIDHRLASMGMDQSGQSVKEASRFNQDVASQDYQNAYGRWNADQANKFNRLMALSNVGVNAAGRTAGLGANAANNVANNQIGIGNAQAAGKIGSSNAYINALNNMQQINSNNRFLQMLGGG